MDTTATYKILKYAFKFYFSEKVRLDISCEASARQMIHIKCQTLVSLKNKAEYFRIVCFSF